jgi:NAD(P)-dependent dehydrogenase (short-subunit alcohol dehydrogenase family)
MHISLEGSTALVSGSTAGIGFAMASGLARAGASVVLNGRETARTEAAAQRIRAAIPDARVRGIAADLATAGGVAAVVADVPSIDILINNLGIFEIGDFFATDDGDWSRFFETNVMSGVRLSRAYLPGMLERNRGRVIFVSSESALNVPADTIHYGFSKTAQLAISRGLAKLTKGTAVTVNALLPGPTLSDGVAAMLRPQAEATGRSLEELAADFIKAHRSSSLLQRAATPDEVANLAVYLASPQASATNGSALRVDGGVVESIG